MFLDIITKVKEILGILPPELTWVYGLCAFFVFVSLICVCIAPFVIVYKLVLK